MVVVRGKGIVTAVFQTTEYMFAPLNGMIGTGIDDMKSSGASYVTLWRWENGISNNNNSTGIWLLHLLFRANTDNPPTTTTNVIII